jgi:hypothetical protein
VGTCPLAGPLFSTVILYIIETARDHFARISEAWSGSCRLREAASERCNFSLKSDNGRGNKLHPHPGNNLKVRYTHRRGDSNLSLNGRHMDRCAAVSALANTRIYPRAKGPHN